MSCQELRSIFNYNASIISQTLYRVTLVVCDLGELT